MDISGSVPYTRSYTVPGLNNGTAYTFQVRAVNAIGEAGDSNEATATPPPAPQQQAPDMITDLSTTVGDAIVILGWSAPGDGGSAITHYEYEVDDSGIWVTTGSTDRTYTVTDLNSGTQYSFQVRPVNGVDAGPDPPPPWPGR